MFNITIFQVGMLQTNCYLIENESTGNLLVIDPGDNSNELMDEIDKRGGKLKYILLTHGHFDHVGFVAKLKEKYDSIVYCNKLENSLLEEEFSTPSMFTNKSVNRFEIDEDLVNDASIEFDDILIKYMHTPGHTKGSGMFIINDVIFSGDTIFCGSIGRTDFPTSSYSDMMSSIERIKKLDGDFQMFPGHDRSTTLSYERNFNPYFK